MGKITVVDKMCIRDSIMSTTFVPRILKEHGVDQYFETLTMSSVCGIRKPRPEIFEIALNEMKMCIRDRLSGTLLCSRYGRYHRKERHGRSCGRY